MMVASKPDGAPAARTVGKREFTRARKDLIDIRGGVGRREGRPIGRSRKDEHVVEDAVRFVIKIATVESEVVYSDRGERLERFRLGLGRLTKAKAFDAYREAMGGAAADAAAPKQARPLKRSSFFGVLNAVLDASAAHDDRVHDARSVATLLNSPGAPVAATATADVAPAPAGGQPVAAVSGGVGGGVRPSVAWPNPQVAAGVAPGGRGLGDREGLTDESAVRGPAGGEHPASRSVVPTARLLRCPRCRQPFRHESRLLQHQAAASCKVSSGSRSVAARAVAIFEALLEGCSIGDVRADRWELLARSAAVAGSGFAGAGGASLRRGPGGAGAAENESRDGSESGSGSGESESESGSGSRSGSNDGM